MGRAACIDSYREFLAAATIHAYTESEPVVHVFGKAAAATIPFDIDYEIAGGRYRETGHDVVLLVRSDGGWCVAWRTLVPDAPAT